MSNSNSGISNESLNLRMRGISTIPVQYTNRDLQRTGSVYYRTTDNRMILSKGPGIPDSIIVETSEDGLITNVNGVDIVESSTVPGGVPDPGTGKIWVKDDTPNAVVFTDDAGTDHILNPSVVNATQLQGVDISATAPADTQVLTYNAGTGEWEPASSGGYTPGSTDLFISQATGNDVNDGLTSLTPVQTFSKLREIAASLNTDEIVVHLYEGENYTGWQSTADSPFEYKNKGQYTNVVDLSAFGAGTIKFITDIATVDTQTPGSTGVWEPVTNMATYQDEWTILNHPALSSIAAAEYVYIPAQDRYIFADSGLSSTTQTYVYSTTTNIGVLSSTEFYNSTQLATITPSANTCFQAGGKKVTFERVINADNPCYIAGEYIFRGGNVSGYTTGDMFIEGCTTSSLSAANLNTFESALTTIDSTNNATIDTCRFTNISNSYFTTTQSVLITTLGTFDNCPGGKFQLSSIDCGTSITITNSGNIAFSEVYINDTQLITSNSILDVKDSYLQGSIDINDSSRANFSVSCTIEFTTLGIGFRVEKESRVFSENTFFIDSAGVLGSALFYIIRGSEFHHVGTISLTTSRTGRLVWVQYYSKMVVDGGGALTFTLTSTSSSHQIEVQRAELIVDGAITGDTTSYLIGLFNTSVLRTGAAAVNNGTAANVIRRGTSAITGWSFDTTWATAGPGGATDKMTLVLET